MNLKKRLKKIKKNYEIDWKISLILTMAIIIGGLMFAQTPAQTIYIYEYNTSTVTVTIPTTSTTTGTTTTGTTSTTTPTIPPGTWFALEVRIVWAHWVLPEDYRRAEVSISRTTDYVCIGSHLFEKTESNSWFRYNTFAVELNAYVLLSMMSIHDAGEYGTPRYNIDYTSIQAGYWSGQLGFYDYHAPSAGEAGWIQYTWVEL